MPSFPEAFTLCFHDPLAGIYDFWVEGIDDKGDLDEGSLLFPLSLDTETGTVVLDSWTVPSHVDAGLAENLATSMRTASQILELLTGIYRRTVSHPRQAGFFPRLKEQREINNSNWAAAHTATKALERICQEVPAALWDGTQAWFAPNSDPLLFGQFYLTTTADNHDVVWEIRQQGLDGPPIDSAAWNDTEGLRRLWSYCLESNPDHLLTLQALNDTDKVRKSRALHQFAIAVRDAREAFAKPKDRLRPRLSETAVFKAIQAVSPVNASGHRTVRATLHLHDLTPFEVFGYRYQHDNLPSIYGAGKVVFYVSSSGYRQNQYDDDSLREEFAQALQPLLDERKLGSIHHVTYDDKTHLWLVKNLDLVKRHCEAFGIPSNAQWG